jgi:hypothetical protein
MAGQVRQQPLRLRVAMRTAAGSALCDSSLHALSLYVPPELRVSMLAFDAHSDAVELRTSK